ncbi:MAG: hypothetical protein GEU75_00225 [Dehalococcoidia bacterium]|nr:hypothetical protein [Dehalococcoidia bacterium]
MLRLLRKFLIALVRGHDDRKELASYNSAFPWFLGMDEKRPGITDIETPGSLSSAPEPQSLANAEYGSASPIGAIAKRKRAFNRLRLHWPSRKRRLS